MLILHKNISILKFTSYCFHIKPIVNTEDALKNKLKNTTKVIFLFVLLNILGSCISFGQYGPILFKGDFNNGILASKSGIGNVWQKYAPTQPVAGEHKWKLDSQFVRQGKYSMRIEVRPGDTTNVISDRAELAGMVDSKGKEIFENASSGIKYIAFSLRLGSTWTTPKQGAIDLKPGQIHGIFFQLHKADLYNDTTGPAFAFQATNRIYLSQSVGYYLSPEHTDYNLTDSGLNKGEWIDFVIKIKFSIDSTGEIVIWRRNKNAAAFTKVLHVININTLLYKIHNGVKVGVQHQWRTGFYRSRQKVDGTGVTNTLWLDGYTIARTAAAAQNNAFSGVVTDLPGDGKICAPPIVSSSSTNLVCNGTNSGSISLFPYLDTTFYYYSWTGPNGFTSNQKNLTNIAAGSYIYKMSDVQGCFVTDTIVVTQPPLLVAQVTSGVIKCFGDTTFTSVTASGGVPPYYGVKTRYEKAGTYTYSVSDIKGCSTNVNITIPEPTLLNSFASVDSALKCFGGTTTISVFASGGTQPYAGTGSFRGGIGDYTFPISDANGCRDTTDIAIKNSPPILRLFNHVETMVNCKGAATGTIKLLVNGGTPPYLYSFNGGISFQTDSLKTGLTAGNYSIVFKDANNCSQNLSTPIIITEPSTVVALSVCYSSSSSTLHLVGSGGVPPYRYSIDGITYKASNAADGGRDYLNISGILTVYTKDNNGCIVSRSVNTGALPTCSVAPSAGVKLNSVLNNNLNPIVFPNPSKATFYLKLEGLIHEKNSFSVSDIYGKILYQIKAAANGTYQFGENFPPGIYVLQVTSGNQKQTYKLEKL